MKTFLSGLLVSTMIFFLQAMAQNEPIYVNLILFNQNTQIFYLGDIDFTGQGTAPEFFILELENYQDRPVVIQLHFELRYNSIGIIEAFSDPFTLPPSSRIGRITFTNNQLNSGLAVIPGTEEHIELHNYRENFGRVSNLLNQITATGKLPAGQYEFFIEAILIENGAPIMTIPDKVLDNNILLITNPTTLEPLYPGNRVAEGALIEIPALHPYFLWQSDALEFNLFVYEKYPNDVTIQDVLSHDPILHIEGYPNIIFQFPTDPSPLVFEDVIGDGPGRSIGPVRMMERGKVYYWYVQAIIPSASGTVQLNSDVYQFKIAAEEGTGAITKLILNYLQQILGDDYDQYMQSLQDASPTGNILLNGSPVDVDILVNLIDLLRQNRAEIQNVSIEY